MSIYIHTVTTTPMKQNDFWTARKRPTQRTNSKEETKFHSADLAQVNEPGPQGTCNWNGIARPEESEWPVTPHSQSPLAYHHDA